MLRRKTDKLRRLDTRSRLVQRRLLIPLTVVLLTLLAGFGAVLFTMEQNHLAELTDQTVGSVVDELDRSLDEQANTLAALLRVITDNAALRDDLKAGNRERLLVACQPIFAELRREHAVTHFYFHGPDRVNLLRVHKPGKHGDLIRRFTAREAERTGRFSSGIELGPLGTFTLRSVQPLFEDGQRIGYVELGKEIEDALDGIHEEYGVELAVAIRKDTLSRAKWEAGMEFLGREANWDRFPDDVLIFTTLPRFPHDCRHFIDETNHTHGDNNEDVSFNGRPWHVSVIPLTDVSGAEVGDLIILLDLSASKAAFTRLVALTASAAMTLTLLLFGFFYIVLRRTDLDIRAQEEQIRESEQRFMDVLRASDDAILLIDGETFVDCNDATARMLGYSCRGEFLMTHPSQLSPSEQPDGRDSFEKAQEMIQTAFENGSHRFEWMHRKADGEDFPVEVTLTPITYHGKTMLHCLWRDLTEEKQANEERDRSRQTMERIFESMPVGVVIVGRDRIVQHANSKALTMMGYGSVDEIVGCECHQSLCPAERRACPILDLGMEVDNAERVLIDKDKKKIPILKTVVSININGEDVLLETFVDISDRKHAEQALKAAVEEAETANRSKSRFLASMSHELRTPLTGILGFADLLLDFDTDEEQRQEYLRTIRSSGRHLLELINDILDLSKIEADQIDVERTPCEPHGILNDVVSIMRSQAQAKGLDLRCRWSGSVPGIVETDGGRLRQILLNLVGNAVKFTQQGVIEVVARLEPFEEGHKLFVDVTDSGIGIPQEKLQSIFEPFVQADNSVTRKFGGTGLGLAISARLARVLGGDITVTSETGVGSTFTVSVDAGDLEGVEMLAAPLTDGMQAGEDALPSSDVSQLGPGSVLLVEDGHINRKLISTVLEQTGLIVSTAENGAIGVDMATRNHYDLILMDMQMPVLDGYAATKKLRNLGYEIPIVAMTAHAMKGDEKKCLAAGCSHYVSKPIEIDTLLATVAEALGRNGRPGGNAASATLSGAGLQPLVSSLPTEEPVFREIVREFVEYLDQLLADMRQAAARKDVARLTELAHSLKGSAGTAGFDALTEPARQLETLLKQQRLDAIDAAIDALAELAGSIHIPTETCDKAP